MVGRGLDRQFNSMLYQLSLGFTYGSLLEAEVEASLQRICEALSLSSDGPDTAKPVAVQPVKLTPMSRGLRFKK